MLSLITFRGRESNEGRSQYGYSSKDSCLFCAADPPVIWDVGIPLFPGEVLLIFLWGSGGRKVVTSAQCQIAKPLENVESQRHHLSVQAEPVPRGVGLVSSNHNCQEQFPVLNVRLGARKASNGQIGWRWEGFCHILAVGLVCEDIK